MSSLTASTTPKGHAVIKNGSVLLLLRVGFSKMGVCFFSSWSPSMSAASSGYTVATVLFNWTKVTVPATRFFWQKWPVLAVAGVTGTTGTGVTKTQTPKKTQTSDLRPRTPKTWGLLDSFIGGFWTLRDHKTFYVIKLRRVYSVNLFPENVNLFLKKQSRGFTWHPFETK